MYESKTPCLEKFTLDNGLGKGYTIYYRRRNGCYYYTVTHNDNGGLVYSKTQKIPRAEFDRVKEQSSGT